MLLRGGCDWLSQGGARFLHQSQSEVGSITSCCSGNEPTSKTELEKTAEIEPKSEVKQQQGLFGRVY